MCGGRRVLRGAGARGWQSPYHRFTATCPEHPAPQSSPTPIPALPRPQVKWSLSVVGTAGTLEVSRGGWGGSRTEYTLSVKTVAPPPQPVPGQSEADPTLSVTKFGFSGCQDEFAE